MDHLFDDALEMLQDLIRIPSFSREEKETADYLERRMRGFGLNVTREGNNVWCRSKDYDAARPTLLLNSHHDTVKPTSRWTVDPFDPILRDDQLTGLGVNDAGASLVSMLMAFRHFEENKVPFNIVFAATAEEEISGSGGIESVYNKLGRVDFAIVGEPTKMDVAVAEKGLLVVDCTAHGVAGHAARDEGDNAILQAMKDIHWFSTYRFPKISPWLGEVKMSVTIVNAGTQHNVIPAACRFTVDIRVTDAYTLEEVLSTITQHVTSEVQPRSIRLQPSGIDEHHPLAVTAKRLNKHCYGSPTCSDQAVIPAPSIKMGPGDSARSHTADEFIFVHELRDGIRDYITFIDTLALSLNTSVLIAHPASISATATT
jgi:acetylornithine deacetylase